MRLCITLGQAGAQPGQVVGWQALHARDAGAHRMQRGPMARVSRQPGLQGRLALRIQPGVAAHRPGCGLVLQRVHIVGLVRSHPFGQVTRAVVEG